MSLVLEPVRIAVEEGEGVLVFSGGRLVAVLAQLSALHGSLEGCWFPEAIFGPIGTPFNMVFEDLHEAEAWFANKVSSSRTA